MMHEMESITPQHDEAFERAVTATIIAEITLQNYPHEFSEEERIVAQQEMDEARQELDLDRQREVFYAAHKLLSDYEKELNNLTKEE